LTAAADLSSFNELTTPYQIFFFQQPKLMHRFIHRSAPMPARILSEIPRKYAVVGKIISNLFTASAQQLQWPVNKS